MARTQAGRRPPQTLARIFSPLQQGKDGQTGDLGFVVFGGAPFRFFSREAKKDVFAWVGGRLKILQTQVWQRAVLSQELITGQEVTFPAQLCRGKRPLQGREKGKRRTWENFPCEK